MGVIHVNAVQTANVVNAKRNRSKMKLNKDIKNKNAKPYACCDEETMTCKSCDFEDSIEALKEPSPEIDVSQ